MRHPCHCMVRRLMAAVKMKDAQQTASRIQRRCKVEKAAIEEAESALQEAQAYTEAAEHAAAEVGPQASSLSARNMRSML